MEIKERLLELMKNEGINAAMFADSIGVQRSSISHILSGRNKPSIDFLEKIFTSYPNYQAEWLIMGKGDMCKHTKSTTLFTKPNTKVQDTVKPTFFQKQAETSENFQTNSPKVDKKQASANLNEEDLATYANMNQKEVFKHKEIERIVIFYTDGSFSHYCP
jgi:transcriptional regulator with XRE-family HTH domain